MKPTFALDLTRDTIALLYRTPKGWLPLGEVPFDAPDCDARVAYLRKTALGLSPMGMATKIVLPASQILYTELHAPGPSREDKRRQIAEGLEGRTPYAVEDLVFDWSGKGATVKVAVVARETLEEAETFAVAHRLNPVSFVAIPEEGSFVGEPWFGPAAAAQTVLPPGETVDRDRDAVAILQREAAAPAAEAAPPDPEVPDAAAPTEAPDEAPDEAPPAATPEAAEDPLPGLEATLNADLPPDPDPTPQPDPAPAPEAPATAPATAAADPAETSDAALSAALADPAPDLAKPDLPAKTAARDPLPEVEEAPFAHVTDPTAFPDGEDDLPPAPPSAALVAFASRRIGAATGPATPASGAPALNPVLAGTAARPVDAAPPRPAPAAARAPAAKGFAGLVTAPSIPGTRAKPKLKPATGDAGRPGAQTGGGGSGVRSPARPGGTFGTSVPPRNRSAVVFMVLVALLLLCLALIAAWSSFYLTRNAASDGAATTELALETVPDIDDEMLADLQDPEGMTDPLPEAAGQPLAGGDAGALATESFDLATLSDEATALALAADPGPGLPAPAPADSVEGPAPVEPAPATQVATSLNVAPPPVEDQDEIFLSAMDAPPPALDAMALPTPALIRDAPPDAPMPPPAFGTVYRFDSAGLLVPTPEGILSPEGVFLIAGRPPVLPPARSERAAELAAAAAPATPTAPPTPTAADASLVTAGTDSAAAPAEAAPEVAAETEPDGAANLPAADLPAADLPAANLPAADPAMAGFRPRPRPDGLVPAPEDDARLTTATDTALATLRPLPRPDIVLAAAAAASPASASTAGPLAPADLGAQAASLAAQAEAQLAAAAALEAQNPSIVAISMRPAARPRDLSRAVEAAVAAAVRAPDPPPEVIETAAAPPPGLKPEELEELDEPELAAVAPSIPTRANVAKQATFTNAINLSRLNLIGTYGTDSRRTALIRQSNGRYKKVKVGDRIDGGTIMAITETEVRYQKGGKLLSLQMPRA